MLPVPRRCLACGTARWRGLLDVSMATRFPVIGSRMVMSSPPLNSKAEEVTQNYCSVKKVSTTLPLSLTTQTKRLGLSLFSRLR